MEKKHNKSCPVKACKRCFKTVTISSPFRPFRHNSNHHSSPASNPSVESSDSIPVVKSHHQTPKLPKLDLSSATQKDGKVASFAPNKNTELPLSQSVQAKKIADKNKATAAVQEKRHKDTRMESNNNNMKANITEKEEDDEFAKYINLVGKKIRRTPSNASAAAATGGGGDTRKDHFSDFINHAKKKMLRTMSSFVGGKHGDQSL